MNLDKEGIENLNRIDRIKIINSVSGIKPANLIGTISNDGQANVAIFSSVVHLGSDPALLGFILRPTGEVPRNTFDNIMENHSYTINHVHPNFIKNAHYTSVKFDKNTSEFEKCHLQEEYITAVKAPFVKESTFKMGMEFREAIPIKLNNTLLVIGEIVHLIAPEGLYNDDDDINLEKSNAVGISGLNRYYSVRKIGEFPYARINEVPEF